LRRTRSSQRSTRRTQTSPRGAGQAHAAGPSARTRRTPWPRQERATWRVPAASRVDERRHSGVRSPPRASVPESIHACRRLRRRPGVVPTSLRNIFVIWL
jgi:hypothetical protein